MPLISIKAVKQSTGLSLPTIRKALKAAGIAANSAGQYDESAALAAIASQVDPARTAGHAVGGKGEVAEVCGSGTRGSLNGYADARARSEEMRAKKLELEIGRRSGELVERNAVERAGIALFTQTRIALMAVGSKVAPRLLSLSEALEAQRIVDEAIRDALTLFADEQATIARMFG